MGETRGLARVSRTEKAVLVQRRADIECEECETEVSKRKKNGVGPKSSTNRADGRSGTDKRGKVSLGRDVVHGARLTKIASRLRLLGMYGLMYGDHEVPTCGRGFTCWDRKKKKKGLALKN